MNVTTQIDNINIAADLDEDKLIEIGKQVYEGFQTDLTSRAPWEKDLESWTKLALQITEQKTFPWTNAANIKFPLLATAAMQFSARAYPTLIPSDGKIVRCRVIGGDPTGEKTARAGRVATHMSYQLLTEMDGWEDDMDRLLISLPIAGTCFKKTYWDSGKKVNCSKLVLPKFLVVNYHTRALEDAERITEVIYLSKRKLKERQNQGVYSEVELSDPQNLNELNHTQVNRAFQIDQDADETTPYMILEQHTYLDLDEDGYAEPYVVTIEEQSQKVLRIVARFDTSGVNVDEKGNVISIEPIQYYTKYGFIPNPDGGFYDIGFGRLLGPINESANTIINQLVDAGSLSNLQAGFIGKGLRIKMGETKFSPGEWKAVNATGDDIKKQIFPLPVRDPSNVLLQLLELLLNAGKELASVAEIFVGKMPGQNTPATTTMASIEQGMKVFTAVYKRVYRSLTKEFRKLYKLNSQYLNPEQEIEVIDEPIQQSDYFGSENDIVPAADPSAVSSQEKQAKVQALMQILQLGTINPMAVTELYLEAFEIPQPEKYLMQPQPQADPKAQELQMKAQMEEQKAMRDMQIAERKLQMEQASKEQDMQIKMAMAQEELRGKQVEAAIRQEEVSQNLQASEMQHRQQMVHQQDNHRMSLATQQQSHQQSMQQQKEAATQKAKQQPKGVKKPNGNKSK
jgi:chaperonin GroES